MSIRKFVIPLRRLSRSSAKRQRRAPATLDQETAVRENENGSGSGAVPIQQGRRFDHTISAAIKKGIINHPELEAIQRAHDTNDSTITWRQCAIAYPEIRARLQQIAADIYGFRSVTVCQIGTLVYNQKLFEVLPNRDWALLFGTGVVPVIEYGIYPACIENHLMATPDPGASSVQSLAHQLRLTKMEFVFLPEKTVRRVQQFLITNLPALNLNPVVGQEMQSYTPAQNVLPLKHLRAA